MLNNYSILKIIKSNVNVYFFLMKHKSFDLNLNSHEKFENLEIIENINKKKKLKNKNVLI